nr:MAG TPA: hypothetical protein [Caudoviricetes sp.]
MFTTFSVSTRRLNLFILLFSDILFHNSISVFRLVTSSYNTWA